LAGYPVFEYAMGEWFIWFLWLGVTVLAAVYLGVLWAGKVLLGEWLAAAQRQANERAARRH